MLDLLIKMASMSQSPSTLKCIALCFYHFQIWMWGLKLAAARGPDLSECFDAIKQKIMCLQSSDPLLLTSSDAMHLSEGLILASRCSDMLAQVSARTALFHAVWTTTAEHPCARSSTCGICMDDLGDAEVRAVCCPGAHPFHVGCLKEFLVFSSICSGQSFVCCPYCRFKLSNK